MQLLMLALALLAQSETQRGPDPLDEESTRLVREFTTDPEFLTEWVDHVPQSASVPSPRDFLGYVVGDPHHLTRPDTIVAYFRELDRFSSRVRLHSMGTSHGGREMVLAMFADDEVLARVDEIRAANARLADPRVTTEEEARAIATSTPATYWVTAGLHSPELGPPEMVMELAYRLAVSEQEHVREIRSKVLTLIVPVLEMDGRARVVDWYYRYLVNVTDREDAPPFSPPYWGDYTFHDNNRDGLQASQPLTRNYIETFHHFLPTVSLDLHESVPLLYVSTGTGPYNETVDPITITEWQWMASNDVGHATRLGLRGVWTWGFYTGWYPGYLLWVTNTHNAVGRFYETFGNHHPGTFPRDLKDATYAEERIETRQWYRPWPPERDFDWSMRNNTNYMQTCVLAALQLAARNGDTLLMNFWQKGRNSIDAGLSKAPFAFHVPLEQKDRASLHHLLWLLREHRIEVHVASADLTIGEKDVKRGDYLVLMSQPYRNFAKTLLSHQAFPDQAELRPYDDIAWSLDLMLGLDVEPIDDARILEESRLARLEELPDLPGSVGDGARFIVDHHAQVTLPSLCWAAKGARIRALAEEWEGHPRGSLLIDGLAGDQAKALASTMHVDLSAAPSGEPPETVDVNLPRVALFHTWTYTQDSGWARYALEELGIPYTLIDKDDLRAGDLGASFDVILVPDQRRSSFARIVHGIDEKWGPMPYTRTEEFPSHGVIDSSPDITGGMGFEGLANLERFVKEGGLLVTLGDAGVLPADGGIARDLRSAPASGTPGSHVTTKIERPEHPVTWGFDEVTHVFHGNTRHFTVPEPFEGRILARYGTKTRAEAQAEEDRKDGIPVEAAVKKDGGEEENKEKKAERPPLCLSGGVKNPSALERKPAILDVPCGRGRVLLFTWNPLHRYQNHHDFSFVTNALLFHDDFPRPLTKDEVREREE